MEAISEQALDALAAAARRAAEEPDLGTALKALAEAASEAAEADTVVIRTHGEPRAALYFERLDQVPEVVRIGDAVAVRWADRAIFDGHTAARAL